MSLSCPGYPINAGKVLRLDQPFAQVLDRIVSRYSATASKLSLSWLLHRSAVMLPIPGTSKTAHLEENVAAAGIQIGPDEWTEFEAAAKI